MLRERERERECVCVRERLHVQAIHRPRSWASHSKHVERDSERERERARERVCVCVRERLRVHVCTCVRVAGWLL